MAGPADDVADCERNRTNCGLQPACNRQTSAQCTSIWKLSRRCSIRHRPDRLNKFMQSLQLLICFGSLKGNFK
jgi:hypothetical protein